MEPGIYRGLNIDDYHGKCGGISKSGISKFRKAPIYYKAYMDEELEKTDALRVGNIIHTFMLEPDKFNESAVFDGRRFGAKWDDFRSEYGDEYLTKKEYDELVPMREALMRHPRAVPLIVANGDTEISAFWLDTETEMVCKTRPDRLVGSMFVDYKTCADNSPRAFSRAIYDNGYHIQAAMAQDGFAANGVNIDTFLFIAQEKKAPYNTEVYSLSAQAVEKGREEYKEALRGIKNCIEDGRWPGYNNNDAVEIDLPYYAYKED